MQHKLLLGLILSSTMSLAQDTQIHYSKNTIFLEAFGVGGYGSINYERRFYKHDRFGIGLRVGFSTYNINDFNLNFNPDLILPISMNFIYGNKLMAEFGIGQTISNTVSISTIDFKSQRNTSLVSNLSLGLRYQKKEKGLMYRVSYTPIIQNFSSIQHWGGFSIGYSF